jgi:uncharacterized protein (UPF0264 family)
MAKLLVSVRSASEARVAVAGGADVIDVKEPRRGSLGRAELATWREVLSQVDGKAPVSVALGELTDFRMELACTLPAGVRFAKLGLARCRSWRTWSDRWSRILHRLPPGILAVAVVYADADRCGAPPPEQIIRHAARLGCWGVLVDTHDKTGGTLLDLLPEVEMAGVVDAVRRRGMAVALAGSLGCREVATTMSWSPDLIAVRSAVCCGGRSGVVDQEKVRHLAQLMPRSV